MIKNTQLSDALDVAQENTKLDEHVENILSNKYLLANIMQGTIHECQNMTINELVSSIEGTPEIQSIPLAPGHLPEHITGDSTECKIPNEGENYYDIRFHAYIPGIKQKIKLLINVEAQNTYNPNHDHVTRGIFYAARMISTQKNTEFTGDNYNDIKNVYSIWICMNVPSYAKDTITKYHMHQEKLFGDFQGNVRYDIITVTFICLGNNPDKTQQRLLAMLETIFSDDIELNRKKHILEETYSLPMTIEFGKELEQMGTFSEYYYDRGVSKGISQGSKTNAMDNAKKFFKNGASYELVRNSIDILTDEELQEIYDEVMGVTV